MEREPSEWAKQEARRVYENEYNAATQESMIRAIALALDAARAAGLDLGGKGG